MLKTAVLAPMPAASVTMASREKPGVLRSPRNPWRRSSSRTLMALFNRVFEGLNPLRAGKLSEGLVKGAKRLMASFDCDLKHQAIGIPEFGMRPEKFKRGPRGVG